MTASVWVYRFNRLFDMFMVGYFCPEGRWFPDSECSTREEAAARVAYLNGERRSS